MRKFWTSERFWAGVLFALAGYLKTYGFVLDPVGIAVVVEVVAAWAAGVATLDRFSEKIGKKK